MKTVSHIRLSLAYTEPMTMKSRSESLNIIPGIWLERRVLRAGPDTEGDDLCDCFEKPGIGFDITAPQRLTIAS